MGRPNQLFFAPGPDGEPSPIAASAWHSGRCVIIPLEHWEVILEFTTRTDPALAEILERYSYTPGAQRILPSATELRVVLQSLVQVQNRLRAAPPLVPEVSDGFPEDFPNEEHPLMVEAAAAVFREALVRQQPFEGDLDT